MSDRPSVMIRISRLAIALVASVSVASACGESAAPTSKAAHPALACGEEGSGIGNYDLIGPGLETTAAALDERLSYYQDLYGGEIVELPDSEAALRVAGANVVVATASATAEGGYLVQEDYFCNSFQPQQSGPPATEPLVTSDS